MTPERKSFDWLLAAIIVLSALLRVYRIASESLWYDECTNLVRIEGGYRGLFADWASLRQGWLYPVILKLGYSVFGSSEIALRLPSAVFGVGCVAAVYAAGTKMFGRVAGLLAALLMAVNPFAILYSQDARPYTLYLLGALGSFYYLVLLMERYTCGRAAGYVVSTLVALFSHPMAVLLLPAHVAGFFIYRRFPEYPSARQSTWPLVRTLLLTAILSYPQTRVFFRMFVLKACGGDISTWILTPTVDSLAETLRHYFMYPLLGVAAMCLLVLVLLPYARSARAARPGLLFLLAVVVFCVFLPWLVSLAITPVYVIRYTIPAFGAVLLALGWALTKLNRVLRVASVVVLMILTAIPLYSLYGKVDRDPFRQTADLVHQELLPGDVVVAHPWWLHRVMSYYLDRFPGVTLLAPTNRQAVGDWAKSADRIWLVSSYEKPGGPDDGVVSAVSAGRKIETDFQMSDRVPMNPWVLYFEGIRVIRYGERAAAGAGEAGRAR